MKATVLPILLAAFTIISCGKQKYVNESVENVDIINFSSPRIPDLDSLIGSIRFVPLEMSKESNVFEASQIFVDSSRIIIFDMFSSLVKAFSSNGKFIGNVGSRGQGPGQYSSANFIVADDSAIYVADYKNKIIKYSKSDYSFVSEKATSRTLPMMPISSQRFALMNSVAADYQIEICDTNFEAVKSFIPMIVNSGYKEWPNYRFYTFNDSVFAFPFHDDCIYYVGTDTVKAIRQLQFGEYGIIPPDVYQEYSDMGRIEALSSDESYVRNCNCLETGSHFISTFTRGSDFYLGVFNKSSGKTDLYYSDGQDLSKLDFIFSPSCIYEEGFVSVSSIEKLKNSTYTSNISGFRTMCDTLPEETDVLVFWYFK